MSQIWEIALYNKLRQVNSIVFNIQGWVDWKIGSYGCKYDTVDLTFGMRGGGT